MKLEWNGNQKYNEDISAATIFNINQPIHMSIHRYMGCGKMLFFDCPALEITNVNLHTEDFDEAETKSMIILKERRDALIKKIDTILQNYYQ